MIVDSKKFDDKKKYTQEQIIDILFLGLTEEKNDEKAKESVTNKVISSKRKNLCTIFWREMIKYTL